MNKRNSHILRTLALCLCITVLIACSNATQAPAQLPGMLVSVLEAKSNTQLRRLDLNGQIVAREQVRITAEMDSLRIVRVLADAGQRVAKDTVLVELDSAAMDAEYAQAQQQRLSAAAALKQAQAQSAQAESALNLAIADAARYASVAELGAVSTQDLEARRNAEQQARDGLTVAKANTNSAMAQQDIAQSALDLALQRRARLKIRAPMAGTLSERKADIGSIVTMADTLFMLMPDGAREFEAELDLNQLASLPSNANAEVNIAQLSQTFKSRLRTRAVNVRSVDRRGPVRFALLDADQVPIGASASAHLTLEATASLSLPPSAVLFDPEPWVYVVGKDQRVQRRNVQLSAAGQELLVVQSGLEEGEWVISNASTLLSPGALIRPVLTDSKGTTDAAALAKSAMQLSQEPNTGSQ
jgi:HlyD family secretion protein